MILDLKFKGSRNYLHGSDIFNSLVNMFARENGGYLSKLVFKRFARHQIEVVLESPVDDSAYLGKGVWTEENGADFEFWLRETALPVTQSYPFDEEQIIRKARYFDKEICLDSLNNYSIIENVIALTKALNYRLFPEPRGKWVFGQINLGRKLVNSEKNILIEQITCIGESFSRNGITIDGQYHGEIRFIVGKP